MIRQYRDVLIDMYLDYVNHYISIDTFAERNGLTFEEALQLCDLARFVASHEHPEA